MRDFLELWSTNKWQRSKQESKPSKSQHTGSLRQQKLLFTKLIFHSNAAANTITAISIKGQFSWWTWVIWFPVGSSFSTCSGTEQYQNGYFMGWAWYRYLTLRVIAMNGTQSVNPSQWLRLSVLHQQLLLFPSCCISDDNTKWAAEWNQLSLVTAITNATVTTATASATIVTSTHQ